MTRRKSKELKQEDSQEETHQMAIQFTPEQFEELLSRFSSHSTTNKNFTRCTLNYNGERDYNKVDEFITGISIYKQIEGISDEDAIAGLPLLLKDIASTWWTGIRTEIKTWPAALSAIRSAFAPKLQPYEVYLRLFEDQQGDCEPIDSFLCRKRALLGMLPTKRHKEEEQIDFVYGLLKMEVKKKIARSDIKSFADMIDKARHLESLEKNEKPQPSTSRETEAPFSKKKPGIKCLFCKRKGHIIDHCRMRLAQLSKVDGQSSTTTDATQSSITTLSKPAATITCYGCGTPGVFRSNCPNCKTKDSPPKPVQFYAYCPTVQNIAKVPTIEIVFDGKKGHAHIDTAARTSIAGNKLYQLMKEAGAISTSYETQVNLADGSSKWMELMSITVEITMGNRVLPINFTVFPDADTRTLLGIDFLQTNGIILDLGQRVWNFADQPDTKYEFLRIQNELTSTKIKKIDFIEPEKDTASTGESLPDFLAWASKLKMLSPIPDTPPGLSPAQNDESSKEKEWKLMRLEAPPPPVRPREPCEICLVEVDLPKREEQNIRDEQRKDEKLNSIIEALEHKEESENYIQTSKRGYLLHKGVLYRFTPDQEDDNAKLMIPRHEITNVIKQFHDTQGWWDVSDFVRSAVADINEDDTNILLFIKD
ncbi:uncharacterized protein [Choristoneura fumiferana]|uniref:uncharacterized protein n=1 Tax=Choristoneura fumiferana TaxID=7141 RepID=UPI003D156A91